MNSLKDLYKIGHGPSSSHTMGPQKAAEIYKEKHPEALRFKVTLYGSLAATGRGHMTDVAITDTFAPRNTEIIWRPDVELPFHPNGMTFEAVADGESYDAWTIFSIGGGALANEETMVGNKPIYNKTSMKDILSYCEQSGKTFWEYVFETEGEEEISSYLLGVWNTMEEAIKRGLDAEGLLPGGLGLQRKAPMYAVKARGYLGSMKSRALIYAYALACSEENASGGMIVTAPTCGSCGVLPSVLYHLKTSHQCSDAKIVRALATAGLIGNIAKFNASISGAEVGCQGEVGVACAMAAGGQPNYSEGRPNK